MRTVGVSGLVACAVALTCACSSSTKVVAQDGGSGGTSGSGGSGGMAGSAAAAGSAGTGGQAGTSGATPVILATGEKGPRDIAVDASGVYWVTDDSTDTLRGLLSGAAGPLTLDGAVGGGFAVAIDATKAYYASRGTGPSTASCGGVFWGLKASAGDGSIWGDGDCNVPVAGLAIDGAGLYFTVGASVQRDTTFQGSPSVLFSVVGETTLGPITAAPTALFFANGGSSDRIYKSGKGSASPTLFVGGQGGVRDLVADATRVYWTTDAGDVLALDQSQMGGTPVKLATGQAGPMGVAIDADNVYWACSTDGTIRRSPKTTGAVAIAASGQSAPVAVAVDESAVYWVNHGDGTVAKVAK